MDKKYTWATEDIYPSEKEWNEDYLTAESLADFEEYKGKLGDADKFYECMKKQEKAGRIVEKLYVYAMMLHDSDTARSDYDALMSRATALSVKFSSATAFIVPELISLDESVLKGYIDNPRFSDYDYALKSVMKEKPHVLSEKEEKLLAESADAFSSFRDIFTKTDNADLPLKPLTHKGEKIPLTHGAYSVIMHSEDRALRKKCFESYYDAYISLINIISATYIGSVKKDVFYARSKNYSSVLESALSGEDVDESVYRNLIKWVNKSLKSLHKYMATKKKDLKLKSMHMYDIYVPVVENAEIKLEYDDAYKLVVEGLAPLGEEYRSLLLKAHDERWISVYETKGKRSGAYSVAVYDTHPYVLLNYQKTTHDVFTIAHEMGHSIHSYFSNRTQPYSKADYKIFVAEVASTVNEVLLLRYLLGTAKDNKLKKYLLSYLLEMIRTTLFRQTQFAEFEEFSHDAAEKDIPLTKDLLSDKYLEINKKYYGKSVVSDERIKYEWARIPHFYRAFYVYKYATGIISALAISDRILKEGQKAVDDYFKFLSSGGSDSPVELLKIAGVDLTKDAPFIAAFRTFDEAVKEYLAL